MSPESFRASVLELAVRWVCNPDLLGGYLFSKEEMMLKGAGPRRIKVTFEILPDADRVEDLASAAVYEEVAVAPI